MMRTAKLFAPLVVAVGATLLPAAAVWAQNAPPAASTALAAAQKQFDACQYAAAVATLKTAIAAAPNDAQLQYWLLRAVYEQRDYDAAIIAGQRAVQLAPGNSEYHYWLGRAYGGKADRERSLTNARRSKSSFENAVKADASNVEARRALMDYLSQAPPIIAGGSKSKAREQIAAIRALNPVEGHLAQAAYFSEDDKPGEAAAEYTKMFALRPKAADPYLEAAGFFINRQDAAKTNEAVSAAAAAEPANPQLPFYRAAALILTGQNFDEAEKQLHAYLQLGCDRSGRPSMANAHELLGNLYEKKGEREKAIAEYRQALKLNAKSKSAQEGLKRLGQKV